MRLSHRKASLLLLMVVLCWRLLDIVRQGRGWDAGVVRRHLRRVASELGTQGGRRGRLLRLIDLLRLLGLRLILILILIPGGLGVLGLRSVVCLLRLLLRRGHAAGGLGRIIVLLGLLLGIAALLDRSSVGLLYTGGRLVCRVGVGISRGLLGGGEVRGGAGYDGGGSCSGVAVKAGGTVAVESNGVECERRDKQGTAVACQF